MHYNDLISSAASEISSLNVKIILPRASILDGLQILVIDDCPDNQFLFSRLLTRRGAIVTLASDGQAGVDLALSKKFDFVMMDIQMPIMDGYAAMEHLKTVGYAVPVVAVTASSHVEEKIKIMSSGFSNQVTKPVNIENLIEIIQNLTQEK